MMAAKLAMIEVDYCGALCPQSMRNSRLLSHSTAGLGVPVSIAVQMKLQGVSTVSNNNAMFDVLGESLYVYCNKEKKLNVYNVGFKSNVFTTTINEVKEVHMDRSLSIDLGTTPIVVCLQACEFSSSIYLTFHSLSTSHNFSIIDPLTGNSIQKFTLPPGLDLCHFTVDHKTGDFLVPSPQSGFVYIFRQDGIVERTIDLSLLLEPTFLLTSNCYSPFTAFISAESILHVVCGEEPTTEFCPVKQASVIGSRAFERDLRNLGAVGEAERFTCFDGPRCLARFRYEISSIMQGGDTRDTHIMTLLDDDLLPVATAGLLSTRCFETSNCQIRADRKTGRVFINDASSILAFHIPWW